MEKKIIVEKGFIYDKIPSDVYKELLASIDISNVDTKKPHNFALAGNIEKEFNVTDLIPDLFCEYVCFVANQYYHHFPLERKGNNKNFQFGDTWLNYQQKHEFNPIHFHSGSLSYVVWIKIPYDLDEELNLPNVRSTGPIGRKNSIFEFTVDNISHPIYVNSEMEGSIIIFNATYSHQVYPFYTSDEYRISLAGNLHTNWVD
jgi:hypothetical protein